MERILIGHMELLHIVQNLLLKRANPQNTLSTAMLFSLLSILYFLLLICDLDSLDFSSYNPYFVLIMRHGNGRHGVFKDKKIGLGHMVRGRGLDAFRVFASVD